MTGPVGEAYAALVAAGELKADPDQQAAVVAIDLFAARLADGHGLIKRMLIGSVSNHVLRHAPCPVLVVREQEPN